MVCFSGDKLLGGPQAGIIIGKKKYIDMMKKNQLTRALRIDKFTAAALEMVLMEYLSEETAVQNIPVLRMIAMPLDEIEKKRDILPESYAVQEWMQRYRSCLVNHRSVEDPFRLKGWKAAPYPSSQMV